MKKRNLFLSGTVFMTLFLIMGYINVSKESNTPPEERITLSRDTKELFASASTTSVQTISTEVPVPISELTGRDCIQKKCSDAEFQAAYDVAVQIVTPLIGLSTEDQLYGIAYALRSMVDNGQVVYADNTAHYNDPYGYLIEGQASCAGCVRATGLCLNILGIPYEHVNEDQWSHQWCRVNVNGSYWICDPYGLYTGPEQSAPASAYDTSATQSASVSGSHDNDYRNLSQEELDEIIRQTMASIRELESTCTYAYTTSFDKALAKSYFARLNAERVAAGVPALAWDEAAYNSIVNDLQETVKVYDDLRNTVSLYQGVDFMDSISCYMGTMLSRSYDSGAFAVMVITWCDGVTLSQEGWSLGSSGSCY